jgi:xanthine dehydrogenase YagR molybdenum-binding subunit
MPFWRKQSAPEGTHPMEMNTPIGTNVLDTEARQGPVGKPLDRVDGPLKVTGGARYAYEVEQGPATTYGYVFEASIAQGRIQSIDSRAAEQSPGVALILTYLNAPEQGTGNHHAAHPVLNSPVVSYYGQPVAFVVAETFEQARAAAYLVRVRLMISRLERMHCAMASIRRAAGRCSIR